MIDTAWENCRKDKYSLEIITAQLTWVILLRIGRFIQSSRGYHGLLNFGSAC